MNALVTLRDAALGRNHAYDDADNEEKSLLRQAVDTALLPLRIATSRPAIKAYITTILFFFTSIALVSVSTTAYLFFYYNFIPQIGLTEKIYLQYGSDAHPYATIPLNTAALISQQPYDIYVSLHMPRTPSNLASGNFMLDLSLLQLANTALPTAYLLNATADSSNPPLARSRRPAIIPFNSYLTSLAHKLLRLPMHLLSLQDLDSSELKISMFERLSFQRGRSNIPNVAYLEVQSQSSPSNCPPTSQSAIGVHLFSSPVLTTHTALQVYSAQLHFHARFEGLRYYVYNYRILSFLLFTSLFYTSAVLTTALAWASISALLSARNAQPDLTPSRLKQENSADKSPIKTEAEDEDTQDLKLTNAAAEDDSDLDVQDLAGLSGTERTFPTLGRHAQPLRYTPSTTTAPSDEAESSWLVQRDDPTNDAEDEDEDEDDEERGLSGLLAGEMADIKDEEDDNAFRGDSGIGTSMESEAAASGSAGLIRRRSSRGSGGRAGR